MIESDTESKLYNIASGCAYSLNKILSVIQHVTGRKALVKFSSQRKLDVEVNCLDISRARRELDWESRISLEEGIDRTWKWLLKTGR